MAYEKINAIELKSALNKLDNISYSKLSNLIGDIQPNEWESPARRRVIEAMNEIIKETKAIQNDIKRYKTVADDIKKYKDLQSDLKTYRSKKIKYETLLRTCPLDDTVNRAYYQSRLSYYKSKIRSNESKMLQLQNNINRNK